MVPEIHTPVLREEMTSLLSPRSAGLLVDVTLGLGGHSLSLLEACPDCALLGIDRDPRALDLARERLKDLPNALTLVCAPFDRLPQVLAAEGFFEPIVILADLGCSSLQLDTAERGFSFSSDGPLDMRMGAEGPTAADFINSAPPEELIRVLFEYGEERRARAISRAILRRREKKPITRCRELVDLVVSVSGPRGSSRIHPATRTFQAIRIAVNDELGQLERFLQPAVSALAPGGRIAVVSFHSLEDRIVKQVFRRLEGREAPAPGPMPEPQEHRAEIRVLTRRPIRPTEEECHSNPRARSARLRIAEKLPPTPGGDIESLFAPIPAEFLRRKAPENSRRSRSSQARGKAA